MTEASRRERLGRSGGAIGSNETVYLTEDWVEVDESDGQAIRRMRVPYDQVLLVTRSVSRLWLLAGCLALPAVSFLIAGVTMLFDSSIWGAGLVMIVMSLGLLAPSLMLAFIGQQVVGVYGERSKARMTFWTHKGANVAHDRVLARVRRARRSIESARPDAAPPPAHDHGP